MYCRLFSLISLLFIFNCIFSKENNDSNNLLIFGERPINASFIGGNDSLINYLKNHFKYPLIYDDTKSKENRIIVKILIDTNGVVKNPKIIKDNVGWLKQEDILDMFLKMPKWKPSIFNGKLLEQNFTIPIFIKIKGDSSINEDTIYNYADVMPEFPGGKEAMMKYIFSNLKYPKEWFEGGPIGKVTVKFYIDVDGSVKDAKILKNEVANSLDNEVLKLISNMPMWKPAILKEKPIKCYYTLPINICITR